MDFKPSSGAICCEGEGKEPMLYPFDAAEGLRVRSTSAMRDDTGPRKAPAIPWL